MTDAEQRAAAKKFAAEWKGRGYEKGETQIFWISLLRNVLGVSDAESYITFEAQVSLGHTSFIDAYIPETRVMIEQKSLDVDLNKPARQSDGSMLTPYQQAKRYADELELSRKPRYIVVCNFKEFHVHDMEHPHDKPQVINLSALPKERYRLSFLVDTGKAHLKREMEVSIKAGELVGKIYDAILTRYRDPTAENALKSLNKLCVRLVFCLYAEDAGIFGAKNQFHDYLKRFEARDVRKALIDLFKVLNTKETERDPYIDTDLAAFPYVNGGLFAEEEIEIPQFDDEVKCLLLEKASDGFDWSEISPTIFGAVFESTLNPETRRSGGMHYTSIENIHKVIDPLFLDELTRRVDEILNVAKCENIANSQYQYPIGTGNTSTLATLKNLCVNKKQRTALLSLQTEIASLTFLDPACGSGNFLTETYLSLRRLENRIIAMLQGGQAELDLGDVIKVSIGQFYGIEINDFAVTVAKTALWIAESQMMRETEDIVHRSLDFLPLKGYANIAEGNALRIDWMELLAAKNTKGAKCFNYIMGNPPFVGARNKSREQAADMEAVFGKAWNGLGNLDYVTCWHKMVADYVLGTTECTEDTENVRCAFVSTNSICQGEAVALLWKPLFERGIEIDFAWRTFRWDSEAHLKAHVHCVIVGFSAAALRDRTCGTRTTRRTDVCQESSCLSCASYTSQKNSARREARKRIYDGDRVVEAANINGYLMDAPNAWIESRKSAICEVPPLIFGSMPNDGGFLSDWNDEAKNEVVSKYPSAEKFFRRLVGSQEFINNKSRWCLWLKGVSPTEIRSIPPVADAVAKVREMRFASKREGTRKLADIPMLFGEIRQPECGSYLIVPRVSSERREYAPIGFMDANLIASDAVLIIPSATLYHFGILTSSVHMAWMRAVAGRLEMRYRYSANIVYNNFPWPGEANIVNPQIGTDLHKSICEDKCGFADCNNDVSTRLNNSVSSVAKNTSSSLCDSLRSLQAKIESTAQAILDARALYSDSSLADLYDEATMPPELRKAHQANDRAVMKAYGYAPTMTESEIVADLMRRYQELTK